MAAHAPKTAKSLLALFDRCEAHLRGTADIPHKRVGAHRYFHLRSCNASRLATRAAEVLNSTYEAEATADNIVAKLHDAEGLSLLVYEHFADDPHPALRLSVRLKSATAAPAVRRYRSNPPVLHRKELLLEPNSPAYTLMRTLTELEETAGLLADPHTIGFRNQWMHRLESMGYAVEGVQLRKLT